MLNTNPKALLHKITHHKGNFHHKTRILIRIMANHNKLRNRHHMLVLQREAVEVVLEVA